MLGVIFYSIISVFSVIQIYSVYKIIHQKELSPRFLTFDIIEIVFSIIIVLHDISKKPVMIDYILGILIVFIILKLIISFTLINWKVVKKYKFFFLALILGMGVASASAVQSVVERQFDNRVLLPITTEEFYQLENSTPENPFVIYVGRPGCNACNQAQPEIEKIICEQNLIAYYYDTQAAREQSEEQMYSLLDKYGVHVVPSVIVFYSDHTSKTITGSNVIEEFKNLV